MHAATCTRSRPRWRSKISTRSADDNILDVMALPRWPSLQPLDRCPHAAVGFYDGAWTVVPRMFTMSQLHLNEQTSTETARWSHQCQLRTHAPQQHACYSITSSARASRLSGTARPWSCSYSAPHARLALDSFRGRPRPRFTPALTRKLSRRPPWPAATRDWCCARSAANIRANDPRH